MDDTNKVKYEGLQGLLDNARKEARRDEIRKDPTLAKALAQRRQQLKEMAPQQRTLSIMRSALRVAREKRDRDLQVMSDKLEARKDAAYAAGSKSSSLVREVLQEAADRDMLARRTITKQNGERIELEPRFVKESEPYLKRPTTRAIKKHREKSRGIGM